MAVIFVWARAQRLRHLALWQELLRLARFLIVGASGLIVNSLCLAFWTDIVHLHYLLGAVLATQCSTLWNFCWIERWAFATRQAGHGPASLLSRLARFLILNNLALALRGPILYGLTSGLGIHYLVSNLISLVVLTAVRYLFASAWIWAPRPADRDLTGSRRLDHK